MHDPYEDRWGEFGFDVETMSKLGRAGSFPPGYIDAYGARQKARHAKLDREIKAVFADAAGDPAMLARLNRPLP
ncbi:MAG: hypothetical protein U1C74_09140 [Phenylobacterium sp.]|nr:hypothetical protein [Phenylobacterium sp.]